MFPILRLQLIQTFHLSLPSRHLQLLPLLTRPMPPVWKRVARSPDLPFAMVALSSHTNPRSNLSSLHPWQRQNSTLLWSLPNYRNSLGASTPFLYVAPASTKQNSHNSQTPAPWNRASRPSIGSWHVHRKPVANLISSSGSACHIWKACCRSISYIKLNHINALNITPVFCRCTPVMSFGSVQLFRRLGVCPSKVLL
jgi:hypothetical protein